MKCGMIDRHFSDLPAQGRNNELHETFDQDMPGCRPKGSDVSRSPICSFLILSRSPVRIKVSRTFAMLDGAMETGGQAAGHDVLRDERHADKAHQAEDDEYDDDGFAGPPKPSRTAKAEPAKRRGPNARRAGPEFVDHGCGTMSLDPALVHRGNSARLNRIVRCYASFSPPCNN